MLGFDVHSPNKIQDVTKLGPRPRWQQPGADTGLLQQVLDLWIAAGCGQGAEEPAGGQRGRLVASKRHATTILLR